MTYDGTTALNPEIAKLIGSDAKSKVSIAIKKAKTVLGIDESKRVLSQYERVKVYNYFAGLYSQPSIEMPNQATPISDFVNGNSQADSKTIIEQAVNAVDEEVFPNGNPQIPPLGVNISSHINNFDTVRVAFYIMRKGERERTVVRVDGFLMNALASIGISRQEVPKWIQAQVNNWSAFDSQLPVTLQVRYLITQAVVKHHSGSDDCFYDLT